MGGLVDLARLELLDILFHLSVQPRPRQDMKGSLCQV